MFFIYLSRKRQISEDLVGTGSNLNYVFLIVCSLFFQKSFQGTQVVISSGIHQEFCKISSLVITDHAPRFDHFLKSTKLIQKKSKIGKSFTVHHNLCLSNHIKQQTWNKANILKKSFQNELWSMKIHNFQAK